MRLRTSSCSQLGRLFPRMRGLQFRRLFGASRLRRLSDRKVNTALSFTLLGGLLILGGCSATSTASPATSNASTKSSTCVRKPPRLTPVTRSKLSTLPPSHDNDVGRRRLPDWYPDADQDANQVPQAGPCRKS